MFRVQQPSLRRPPAPPQVQGDVAGGKVSGTALVCHPTKLRPSVFTQEEEEGREKMTQEASGGGGGNRWGAPASTPPACHPLAAVCRLLHGGGSGPCAAAALLTPRARGTLRTSPRAGSNGKAEQQPGHLFWVKMKRNQIFREEEEGRDKQGTGSAGREAALAPCLVAPRDHVP